MQTISFTKMHGLGNDFIVINTLQFPFNVKNFPFTQLANRYTGIGFDQLLLIGPSRHGDFSCRFFNSDGSEAEQCGNGLRCIARFIHEKKLSAKNILQLETPAGLVEVTLTNYTDIRVQMTTPELQAIAFPLQVSNQTVLLTTLTLGNPHAILTVPAVLEAPLSTLGKTISTHPHFPSGVNVGFMEIVNRQHIRLRTYERGAGETLACGSNACAATVAGITQQLLDHRVQVELALGSLWIEWPGLGPVAMTGPAESVFAGEVDI